MLADEEMFFSKSTGDAVDARTQDEDDPWAAIAAPPPSTAAKPLGVSSSATSRGVGMAPRVRQAQHVSLDAVLGKKSDSGPGRGRGRSAPMKLGVQRINRSTD